MTRRTVMALSALAGAVALLLCAAAPAAASAGANAQSDARDGAETVPPGDEYLILRVCESVVHTFEDAGRAAWPGYSLAEQQFLVYVPDRWALLVSPSAEPAGFGPPPADWPALGFDALYHDGAYRDLVGQLAFSVDVGGVPTVAVGIPSSFSGAIDRPALQVYAYIVHEAFHQYQRAAFGEIPWSREERYPIEDMDNAALAWLEMRLLEDALEAASEGDLDACERRSREFAAVRTARWEAAPGFVAEYEQGKELLEGTAKYVELRCVERAGRLDYVSSLDGSRTPLADSFTPPDGSRTPLADSFAPARMARLVLEELRSRMSGGRLEPKDIPRNRIYAVAAAQAYLLDLFGVDWKAHAEEAGPDFTFVSMLRSRLGLKDEELAALLGQAREAQGYAAMEAAALEAAALYAESCEAALEAFREQGGKKIDILVGSNGLSRSRLTSEDKLTMESGRACLCPRFDVYTLSCADWSFELKEAGLMERTDWDAGERELSFREPGEIAVSVDGGDRRPLAPETVEFDSIEMVGGCFELSSERPGRLEFDGDSLRIDFIPEPD